MNSVDYVNSNFLSKVSMSSLNKLQSQFGSKSSLPISFEHAYYSHQISSMRKPKNNGIRMTLAPMHKVLNTKNETYETILTFIYRTLALNEEQKELAKKINKEHATRNPC